MIKKFIVNMISGLSVLTSLSIRLTKLTGKSDLPTHPKHLVEIEKPWYLDYINKNDKILDLGCGTGQTSMNAAKKAKYVYGLDIDLNNIKTAQKLIKEKRVKNIEFSQVDADGKLPFKDNSFDKIIMFDVLEHLNHRNEAILEVKRMLKNNGTFLLVADNPNTSWKKLKKAVGVFHYADHDHKYEYSKEEIINLLKKYKFEIISIRPIIYDTPLKPIIDLIGGISLTVYLKLTQWRINKVKNNLEQSTGYKIIATNNKS